MGVVGWRRILEGTEITGKVGESLRIVEKWEVRTDHPATSKLDILQAIPCGWFSAHWELGDCKAQEFSLSPNNRTGMIWTVSATFYIPPREKDMDTSTNRPKDYWEGTGGVSIKPVFTDINGDMIVNSAKDPMEGLEGEREENTWTLVKYYTDDSWMTDRQQYSGSVNNGSWAGGAAHTWKCNFKTARLKELQNVNFNATASGASDGTASGGSGSGLEKKNLVETVWEFRYDLNTWKLMPWDVGFMELVAGKRQAIKDDKGNSVKQPVALNTDGTKKSPGSPPVVIKNGQGAKIYVERDFASKFGTPNIIPV